jgi:hypothetical protein
LSNTQLKHKPFIDSSAMPTVASCEDIIMNTKLLLFAATVAISVIGSTVALADDTGYASRLTCAQASVEWAQPTITGASPRAEDAAQGTKVNAATRTDS